MLWMSETPGTKHKKNTTESYVMVVKYSKTDAFTVIELYNHMMDNTIKRS